MDKAIEYHIGFINLFKQLTTFPDEGKSRRDIREGLRSIVYVSPIVFYRILTDYIRIVRMLHQSQSATDYLEGPIQLK